MYVHLQLTVWQSRDGDLSAGARHPILSHRHRVRGRLLRHDPSSTAESDSKRDQNQKIEHERLPQRAEYRVNTHTNTSYHYRSELTERSLFLHRQCE